MLHSNGEPLAVPEGHGWLWDKDAWGPNPGFPGADVVIRSALERPDDRVIQTTFDALRTILPTAVEAKADAEAEKGRLRAEAARFEAKRGVVNTARAASLKAQAACHRPATGFDASGVTGAPLRGMLDSKPAYVGDTQRGDYRVWFDAEYVARIQSCLRPRRGEGERLEVRVPRDARDPLVIRTGETRDHPIDLVLLMPMRR